MLRHKFLLLIAGVFLFAHHAFADIAPSPNGPLGAVQSGPDKLLFVFFCIVVLAVGTRVALAVIRGRLRRGSSTGHEGGGEAKEGFRPVHLVVTVVILGILALIAVPNFLNFRLKAKTSEGKSNLGAIRGTEVAFVAEWGFFVGNQPMTPMADRRSRGQRRGTGQYYPFVQWNPDTRFSILGFAPEGKVMFSYSLEGTNYPAEDEGFTARAEVDSDGDGKLSISTITNTSTDISHSGDDF